MIKHCVAFSFRDDVSAAERQSILDELNAFPKQFPAMRNWKLGANISQRDQTFSHTFMVEFEAEHELRDYLATERHEEFVANRFRPNVSRRAIVTLNV
jgi:hypothetical protein